MKKIIMLFLCLFMLTSCGKSEYIPIYQKDGYSVKVTYHLGEGTWNDSNTIEFQYKPNTPVGQIGIDFNKGETPKFADHTLEGWYTDPEFTQLFDFENTRTVEGEEIHLYAKWVSNTSYFYRVVYINENGEEVIVDDIPTAEGLPFESILVRNKGYIALGYFQDKECTIPWDDSIVMRAAAEGELEVIHKVYSTWLSDKFKIVTTAAEFNSALASNNSIYLTADIDFTGEKFRYMSSYSGTIEGNGHTISNITLNSLDCLKGDNKKPIFGLFESLYGATINDLTIENLQLIVETRIQIEIYVGILAGKIEESTLKDVNISGKLIIEETQTKLNKLETNYTDVAYTIENSTIENCSVDVTYEDLWKI